MTKITDLLKIKTGTRRIRTISIKPSDTVCQIFNKASLWLAKKNNFDWKKVTAKAANKRGFKLLKRVVLTDAEKAAIKVYIHSKSSKLNYVWLAQDRNHSEKTMLFIADPDSYHRTLRQTSMTVSYRNIGPNLLQGMTMTYANRLFLAGELPLYNSMLQDFARTDAASGIVEADGLKRMGIGTNDIIPHIKADFADLVELMLLSNTKPSSNYYAENQKFENDFANCTINVKDNDAFMTGIDDDGHFKYSYKAFRCLYGYNRAKFWIRTWLLLAVPNHQTGGTCTSSHATFCQQKKDINHETLLEMQRMSNSFTDYFSTVEIDNQVDLRKLRKIIPELSDLLTVLPHPTAKPALRFRKLGNLHALGAYEATSNTLAIDFRKKDDHNIGIQSFIHEYGHYLDFQSSNYQLSLQEDFDVIRIPVVHWLRMSNEANSSYLARPTEIFARAFEIYISSLGYDGSLIASPSHYAKSADGRYRCFDSVRDQIKSYFDVKFPQIRKLMTARKQKVEKQASTMMCADKIREPKSVKQLCLF